MTATKRAIKALDEAPGRRSTKGSGHGKPVE
jgi:hypothetical protein